MSCFTHTACGRDCTQGYGEADNRTIALMGDDGNCLDDPRDIHALRLRDLKLEEDELERRLQQCIVATGGAPS